jgi:general secretion pathway protein G
MKKAFTLMELLIVLLILGLLSALVLPNIIGKGEEAKSKIVCIQMKNISNAIDMFKIDNGNYPETSEGLLALTKNPNTEKYPKYAKNPYLKNLPKDAWGSEYIYLNENGSFNIISLGADKKEGNDDISLEDCEK